MKRFALAPLVLAILPFALAACATLPASATMRSDGFAQLGERTRVGALVVTPLRVEEDSRCPINARCVWAGRLVVLTRIEADGSRETTDMELGRPYVAHGRGIQLSAVLPEKMTGANTRPLPYTFKYEGG